MLRKCNFSSKVTSVGRGQYRAWWSKSTKGHPQEERPCWIFPALNLSPTTRHGSLSAVEEEQPWKGQYGPPPNPSLVALRGTRLLFSWTWTGIREGLAASHHTLGAFRCSSPPRPPVELVGRNRCSQGPIHPISSAAKGEKGTFDLPISRRWL